MNVNDIELWHGDCLELMKDIADKSIDMILCDLPYGTTACKWDSIIPFYAMWEQVKRIVKSNTPIILFGSQPFTLFVKDDVIDICYKKQYSRRVYSHSSYKINSFRWEKATKFNNVGKLRYESSDDLVPVIKEYFSSRLREGASMRYKMKKILKKEGF